MSQIVAVLTKNRPEAFERCVTSLKRNAELYGHSIQLIVADDSTPENAVQNARTLASLGLPFTYCDRKFKEQFLSRFGLAFQEHPAAYGAARNFLSLFAAGQKLIMIDDDMECKFAPIPNGVGHGQQAWVWKGGELIDVDFIGKHQELLNGNVVLTMGGWVGDSGMTNAFSLLQEPEFMRKIDSAELLDYVLSSRQILVGTSDQVVVSMSECVSMSMGVDTNGSLPPFLPMLRGEDNLFGFMIGHCSYQSSAYCNYAMHHTPKRHADINTDLKRFAVPSISSLMIQLLFSSGPLSYDAFGEKLQHVTDAEMEALVERRTACILQRLDSLNGLPDFIINRATQLREALKQTPKIDPNDFRPQMVEFGKLICAWPQIVESARALNERGIGTNA